jgi:hypothetical protein
LILSKYQSPPKKKRCGKRGNLSLLINHIIHMLDYFPQTWRVRSYRMGIAIRDMEDKHINKQKLPRDLVLEHGTT